MRALTLFVSVMVAAGPAWSQDEYPFKPLPIPAPAPPSPFKTLKASDAAGLLVIEARTNTGSRQGTAVIVDVEKRLALTAWHGVAGAVELSAHAPGTEVDTDILSAQDAFRARKGIPFEVAFHEPAHDLALMRLADLPKGCSAIPLAKSGPAAESALYLDGNPFDKNLLWQRVEGKAGTVRDASWRWPDGQEVVTRTLPVKAACSLGRGYSGGAVRNAAGELVGLVIAGIGSEAVSIDGEVIRGFLERAQAPRKPANAAFPKVETGPKGSPR